MVVLLLLQLMLEDGTFFNGSLDNVFRKAADEKKLIMVDVYATWCGPCKLLESTTFKDERVQRFLTEKMIGYRIDAEKGEGIDLARKYRVIGYPCLLILDDSGRVISRTMGYMTADAFLNWAGRSLK